MTASSTYNAAGGTLKTDGTLRFDPNTDLGTTTLTFNNENILDATEVTTESGTSTFEIISSGTTSSENNNDFYKDYTEFSADEPASYYVIKLEGGQEYIFFPEAPDVEGAVDENIQLVESVPPCFTAGTLILTVTGEQPIETLKVGDRIVTRDGGSQTLRWIGRRRMKVSPAIAPIRILADALGEGVPEREVRVSPLHRVLVRSAKAQMLFGQNEILVAAKFLLNDTNILRDSSARVVDYVHLMFDDHAVVYTEGLLSESLQAGAAGLATLSPEARVELLSIFPERAEQGKEGHVAVRRTLRAREAAVLK